MALEGGGYGFVDADGNQYEGGNIFGDFLEQAMSTIGNGPIGQAGLNYLIENDKICTISQGDESICFTLDNGDTRISWTGRDIQNFTGNNTNEQSYAFGMDLAHELGHSITEFMGINDESTWYEYSNSNMNTCTVPKDDIFACAFENVVRKENNIPRRTYYSGYEFSYVFSESSTLYPHPQSRIPYVGSIFFYNLFNSVRK